MKSQFLYRNNAIIWAALIVTLASAASTYWLSSMPFGTIFTTSLYIMVAGLVLLLILLGARLLVASSRWSKTGGWLLLCLSLLIIAAVTAISVDYKILPYFRRPENLSSAQWVEDLKYLSEEMAGKHPALFSYVPVEIFYGHVDDLERRIPELGDKKIEAEFAKIIALPNDAHSFPNIFSLKLDWHIFPLQTWYFDSGMHVLDAGREYRRAVGSRLVMIDDTAIDDVYEIMRPYLAAENELSWKERFGQISIVAEWLEAAGIIEDRGRARFTFAADDGGRFTIAMRSYHYLPVLYWTMMSSIDNELSYIYPNNRKDNYRFELQEDTGTLYFQFNRVLDQPEGESLEEFTNRLEAFVDTHDFDRFVIDLRKNDGGGVPAMHTLLEFIVESGKINRRGRLFALTSRRTFSAAVIFLSMLRNNSNVIVIGEPTGQGPVFCGGPQTVVLPNSKREFLISRVLNQACLFPDRRESIEPDIYTDYTREDFLSGRDPALEAVLAYNEEEIVEEIGVDKDVLDGYAGRYIFSPYQILTVERRGGGLAFSVSDFLEGSYQNVRSGLRAVSDSRFVADIAGVEMRFLQDAQESPEAVELIWMDREITLRRATEGFMLPMELLQEGRVHEGIEALSAQRDIYRENIPDLESTLNRTGYVLLRERKCPEAIAVFRLNVELYPESSNTYDSLGEAYMENGDTGPAVENYEKSLELDPNNDNAVRMLERLTGS